MNSLEKTHPFDGIHFLYNLPSVHLPHEDAGFIGPQPL